MEEPIGRRYWGKLKREQVYGNTPPVLVETPDPERTPELRRTLRQRVTDTVAEMNIKRPVAFAENTGAAHVVPFHNDTTGATLLFLVNKSIGRCHHIDLRLNTGTSVTGGDAWCDFDSHNPCVFLEDNVLRTPDFAHTCIVTLK